MDDLSPYSNPVVPLFEPSPYSNRAGPQQTTCPSIRGARHTGGVWMTCPFDRDSAVRTNDRSLDPFSCLVGMKKPGFGRGWRRNTGLRWRSNTDPRFSVGLAAAVGADEHEHSTGDGGVAGRLGNVRQ